MCSRMIDGTQNKTHKLLDATVVFILGEYVTGISGKVLKWTGDSGSYPVRAPWR